MSMSQSSGIMGTSKATSFMAMMLATTRVVMKAIARVVRIKAVSSLEKIWAVIQAAPPHSTPTNGFGAYRGWAKRGFHKAGYMAFASFGGFRRQYFASFQAVYGVAVTSF